MKVAIYQSDILWESVEDNLSKTDKVMGELAGKCDLLVLPEMFTTGFTMSPEKVSETMDGKSISFMLEATKKHNIAIIGSLIISEDGKNYNRMVFITPEGKLEHYDKRHLFRMSGEDNHFTSGKERKIFRYKEFNILPLVCYDLRFPVWSRNVDCKYDIAIYIASWPIPRIKVWDTLLQARALENICYVVGVNRVGSDPSISYNGHSCIINYLGDRVAQTEEGEEQYIIYEIKKDSLDSFREKFPAHLDADNFTVEA